MDIQLESSDPLTIDIVESGVVTWEDLVRCVKNFHYGRNANRHDFDLVWYERKGTCSSKHAFLKMIADLNNIRNVELILAIYKMDANNTPGVGSVLEENDLSWIPEAHCYLKIDGVELDVTSTDSSFERIKDSVIETRVISPDQVASYKVDYHKKFLVNWVASEDTGHTFDEVWTIREKCIDAL